MTDDPINSAVVQPLDDSLLRQIQAAIPKAQYRPYKLWMLTNRETGDRTDLRILNIKVNNELSFSFCPAKHLVAKGRNYLDTKAAMHIALLRELGLPDGAPVTQTDIGKFDIDGEFIKLTPPANREPASPPEPDPVPQDTGESSSKGLFSKVTEALNMEDDDPDPNEVIQPSLF
jgi:hypothetical protein